MGRREIHFIQCHLHNHNNKPKHPRICGNKSSITSCSLFTRIEELFRVLMANMLLGRALSIWYMLTVGCVPAAHMRSGRMPSFRIPCNWASCGTLAEHYDISFLQHLQHWKFIIRRDNAIGTTWKTLTPSKEFRKINIMFFPLLHIYVPTRGIN